LSFIQEHAVASFEAVLFRFSGVGLQFVHLRSRVRSALEPLRVLGVILEE